jgi:hypothetical protein
MDKLIDQTIIKTRTKKPDLYTRQGKYFTAKMRGMNKSNAALAAGYPDGHHTSRIEATKAYQVTETHYKDELLKRMPIGQLADEHVKNILQDQDKGAKNKAIDMALNKIEPQGTTYNDEDDRVVVVLK